MVRGRGFLYLCIQVRTVYPSIKNNLPFLGTLTCYFRYPSGRFGHDIFVKNGSDAEIEDVAPSPSEIRRLLRFR